LVTAVAGPDRATATADDADQRGGHLVGDGSRDSRRSERCRWHRAGDAQRLDITVATGEDGPDHLGPERSLDVPEQLSPLLVENRAHADRARFPVVEGRPWPP